MPRQAETLKIYGPPGTGKTTTALGLIEQELADGVPPDGVALVTFTRNAASEAKERMGRRFGLAEEALPYVRTIHSLCYRALRVGREALVDGKKLADWGQAEGWTFAGAPTSTEDGPMGGDGGELGDWLLGVWDLARNRLLADDLPAVLRGRPVHPGLRGEVLAEVRRFTQRYEAWKRAQGLIDFTDMLTSALTMRLTLPVVSLYVDEAQDLSPLQWRVVRQWAAVVQRVTVLGDDDQALYEFNGADPSLLMDWPADETIVLAQSYRLSGAVHRVAQAIITRNRRRADKPFHPRPEAGRAAAFWSMRDLPLRDGSWFILARNRMFLTEVKRDLMRQGVPFAVRSGWGPLTGGAKLRAAASLLALARGEMIALGELADVYEAVPSILPGLGRLVTLGAKTQLEARLKVTGEEHRGIGPADLAEHGLTETALTLLRQRPLELVKAEPDWRRYIGTLAERHGPASLTEPPRVTLSTIHGVKGEEADHVALLPLMTRRTLEGYRADPEGERRAFYVGATRARHSLWLGQTYEANAFPWPRLEEVDHAAD